MGFEISRTATELNLSLGLVAFGHDSSITFSGNLTTASLWSSWMPYRLQWYHSEGKQRTTWELLYQILYTLPQEKINSGAKKKEVLKVLGVCTLRLQKDSAVFISRQRKSDGQGTGLTSGISSERDDRDRNIYCKRSSAPNRGL